MTCNMCDNKMTFRGVGYRGEKKGKELWGCRCGYREEIQLFNPPKEVRKSGNSYPEIVGMIPETSRNHITTERG